MERTFLMIQPDADQRNLIGELVSRIERNGLELVDAKLMTVPKSHAAEHYAEHTDRPFYGSLMDFITSAPVFAMVVEGEDAVHIARHIIGSTNPSEATPGTIRGDFGLTVGRNIIHGSDSVESANKEINLWFNAEELS